MIAWIMAIGNGETQAPARKSTAHLPNRQSPTFGRPHTTVGGHERWRRTRSPCGVGGPDGGRPSSRCSSDHRPSPAAARGSVTRGQLRWGCAPDRLLRGGRAFARHDAVARGLDAVAAVATTRLLVASLLGVTQRVEAGDEEISRLTWSVKMAKAWAGSPSVDTGS